MPRKHQDPVVGVVNYFEEATEDAAKTAYQIVGAIMRRRFAEVTTKKPSGKKSARTRTGPGPATSVGE